MSTVFFHLLNYYYSTIEMKWNNNKTSVTTQVHYSGYNFILD